MCVGVYLTLILHKYCWVRGGKYGGINIWWCCWRGVSLSMVLNVSINVLINVSIDVLYEPTWRKRQPRPNDWTLLLDGPTTVGRSRGSPIIARVVTWARAGLALCLCLAQLLTMP